MSTAEAAPDPGVVLDKEQPPKEADNVSPGEERGGEGQQKSVSASGDVDRSGAIPVKSIVVLEFAWLAFLGYLAHLLFF